eukprot:4672876-Ditylum_brightwellii.AAC.1
MANLWWQHSPCFVANPFVGKAFLEVACVEEEDFWACDITKKAMYTVYTSIEERKAEGMPG